MRAVTYQSYGSPEVLELRDIPVPKPRDGDVLLRVVAASVNPLDWHLMRGEPYLVRLQAGLRRPKQTVLGADVAGRVEAVGAGVTDLEPGDEVFGQARGSFAEYACAPQRSLATKAPEISFEHAAAVPIAALTALQGLRDKAQVRSGQHVLINGAAGGVGTFAVQIAKSFGAEVTGVCSTRNVDLVGSIGADHVVDYTTDDFTTGQRRYDAILDCVGNRALSDCRRVMAKSAVFVGIGAYQMGDWIGPLITVAKAPLLSLVSSQKFGTMLATTRAADLTAVGDLITAGQVTPVIDRTYALAEAAEAVRYLEGGHARGKVVLSVAGGA